METITILPPTPAKPASQDISLRVLPPDDPINSYPINIQKAIYLLAGIVKRLHTADKKN